MATFEGWIQLSGVVECDTYLVFTPFTSVLFGNLIPFRIHSGIVSTLLVQ
jgi:hypothetical protein